jgi:hypothetical protein
MKIGVQSLKFEEFKDTLPRPFLESVRLLG